MPGPYSQQAADKLLGVSKGAVSKWLRRRRALGVPVVGLLGDNRVTDEFLRHWESEHASGYDAIGRPVGKRSTQRGGGNDAGTEHVEARITGLTPAGRKPDPDGLWKRAIEHQSRDAHKTELRYSQAVEIPDSKPVLLVLLSDLHLGNAHTDYASAKRDAELVRDTPGAYAAVLGDVVDSWITPKLAHIQREQPFPYAEELALLESWLGIMRGKLVAVVAGNHDLRSYEMAGLDLLGRVLSESVTLYDQYEIRFTLRLGEASWRWKLRHEWSGKSVTNQTYGIEKDSRFNDGTWDFAVGGHTHAPTVFREFFDHAHDHSLKMAVQLGSYELDSAFGRRLNMPRIVTGGSAGIMFWPDGRWQTFRDIEVATRFLAIERARVNSNK